MAQAPKIPEIVLIAGANCLRRQIDLLELRIEQELRALTSGKLRQEWFHPAADALRLDTETYYTVANDLLGIVGLLLEPGLRGKLRRESTYKLIRHIRSALVRHSFDKPDGDPYPGFGFGGATGVQLRTWSQDPRDGFRDPGFYENRRVLQDLLHRYAPGILGLTDESKAWFAKQFAIDPA